MVNVVVMGGIRSSGQLVNLSVELYDFVNYKSDVGWKLSFLSRRFSSLSMRLASLSALISSQASIPSVLWQLSGTTLATRMAPPGGKGLLIMWDFQGKLISEHFKQSCQSAQGKNQTASGNTKQNTEMRKITSPSLGTISLVGRLKGIFQNAFSDIFVVESDISFTLNDPQPFFLSVIFNELVAAAAIGIFLS